MNLHNIIQICLCKPPLCSPNDVAISSIEQSSVHNMLSSSFHAQVIFMNYVIYQVITPSHHHTSHITMSSITFQSSPLIPHPSLLTHPPLPPPHSSCVVCSCEHNSSLTPHTSPLTLPPSTLTLCCVFMCAHMSVSCECDGSCSTSPSPITANSYR